MKGSALNVVLATLESLGYKVAYRLLKSADYGVPQTRERVIFIGSRDGRKITFPQPTHTKESNNFLPSWRTLTEGLEGLLDLQPEYTSYSEKRLKYLTYLRQDKTGDSYRRN